MKHDPEKYHRQSLRLKTRDYSRDGYYFVTICARNRENIFADFCVGVGLAPTPDLVHAPDYSIYDQGHPQGAPLRKENTPTLVLTAAGRIIEKNWRKIAEKNIHTDAFIIMPNHIHGIIIIKSHALGVGAGLAPAPDSPDLDNGQPQGSTNHPPTSADTVCLPPQGGLPLRNDNAPAPNLGSIIGAFKSRCAHEYLKFIDEKDINESAKIWQRNYYEHVIRDRKELAAIRNYIKSNPANWAKDEENPINI
ncbi:MAG: hypothetical protein E4H23_10910 [Chrysiogenales bacterium]|nr:MAG: hypothetical protein E4H23_10910 [Chrysiogenales bacterium]